MGVIHVCHKQIDSYMELTKQVTKARDSNDNHMFLMLIGQKFAADVFFRD